ncbi:SAM-dependent methyltransferase [Natranaeroarchaeum aerophilus]|uniref:Methyltransferase domain-containing protein n=1 Tax=Natranaeroarchaeum aerophilus TaxID=2917711 RepID=A0AAE3K6V4_9EURY|nr:methyltransferase domain-containing protein [Natranaeroarchaeum aerophilus]MCL9813224.1 methyltransferase domain-containing protein [Natranaeroarchaeum aerophilus]
MDEIDSDAVSGVYDELQDSHEAMWDQQGHRSLHYGYYDDEHDEPATAVENTTRILATLAGIESGDRVLNVGCGAGAESIWIAAQRGAEVVGIDVNEGLLEFAREHARKNGVAESVTFRTDDFHELTTVEDDSVDVVWGLEALCHARDLDAVLEQVARVLAPGGRLVVGDLFQHQRDLDDGERNRLGRVDDGFGVSVTRIDALESGLDAAGFTNVSIRDVTEAVRPSVRRRGITGLVNYPVQRLRGLFGSGSDRELALYRASYEVYKLVGSGALGYYIVTAER